MKTKEKAKVLNKSEFVNSLASKCGDVEAKQVKVFLDALEEVIKDELNGKAEAATIPGLMKISKICKPATKERKGINPFTKEEVVFKAKPAKNVVKIKALKALKDMI